MNINELRKQLAKLQAELSVMQQDKELQKKDFGRIKTYDIAGRTGTRSAIWQEDKYGGLNTRNQGQHQYL